MISPLALQAKRVIEAAWLHGAPYDLAAQAAFALESAQLLQSPESVAEMATASDAVALLDRAVVELKREHEETARLRDALRDATDQIAGLESELGGATAEVAALNARLREAAMARTWRLENGKKFVYAEDIAPALLGLEQETSAVEADVSPQVEKLRGLLSGQRAAVEDPHDSPLHHDYRVGRDLPELGGVS